MRISATLCTAMFILGLAGQAVGQTADEIAARVIEATGGREALGKVTSRSASGQMTVSTPGGDLIGTIELLNARPNKSRTLITLDLSAVGAGQMTVDQRFDGTAGYALDSMRGDREITGSQLSALKQNAFPSPFLDYAARGTKIDVAGREKLGDRDAWVLTMTGTDGSVSRVYVDAQTYLHARTTLKVNVPEAGGEVEQSVDFSDYREVDGVKVPFVLKSSSAIQNFTIVLSAVEHNVTVDEALFAKPAAK